MPDVAYCFFDSGAGNDRGWRGRTKAATCAGSTTSTLVIALAVFVGLAGALHGCDIVLVRFFMRGFVHHLRHRHVVRLDTAVVQGMMAHAAFESRHSRDALHGQGDDEQAQEK
ncbi:hypothetical protein [Massilia alkalitolerans]|uniref:hypothetical protein n=1 Tax=Massilia alkalitolerans TaxID=286638 RepID=UPI00048496B0|nr:hypothetical protein [Massilia alkalitolerans]